MWGLDESKFQRLTHRSHHCTKKGICLPNTYDTFSNVCFVKLKKKEEIRYGHKVATFHSQKLQNRNLTPEYCLMSSLDTILGGVLAPQQGM